MSYCVNCGVELDASLKSCPLCHTPVINPNELQSKKPVSPYPAVQGQVDTVKRRDLALLSVIVLTATALSCLLLNLFVFSGSPWSLYIIGACLVLLVLFLPAFLITRLPIYISLLFDGIAIGVYLYMISFNTADNRWFFRLALPIVALLTILIEIFTLLHRCLPISFVTTTLYLFVELAVLCVGIELLIDHYFHAPLHLVWSAIVLTVCSVIVIMLITVLCVGRLREALRRRLHF